MLQPAPEIVQEKRPTGRPPRRAPVNATMIAQVILNRPLGGGEASVAGHMLEITEQARAAAATATTAAALVNGHGTKESPIMLGDEADPNAHAGASGSAPNDKKRKASPKENDDPKKKRKTNELVGCRIPCIIIISFVDPYSSVRSFHSVPPWKRSLHLSWTPSSSTPLNRRANSHPSSNPA
jgi:hypothetical protein